MSLGIVIFSCLLLASFSNAFNFNFPTFAPFNFNFPTFAPYNTYAPYNSYAPISSPVASPFDSWNSSLQSRIDFIKRIQTTNCASASDSVRFWNTLNLDQRNWIVNSTNLINSYTSHNSAALQWANLNNLNSGLQTAIQNLNKSVISDSTLKAFVKQISLSTCLSRSLIQTEIVRQLQAPLNALFNTSDTSDRKSGVFRGIYFVDTLESYLVAMSMINLKFQLQFQGPSGSGLIQY